MGEPSEIRPAARHSRALSRIGREAANWAAAARAPQILGANSPRAPLGAGRSVDGDQAKRLDVARASESLMKNSRTSALTPRIAAASASGLRATGRIALRHASCWRAELRESSARSSRPTTPVQAGGHDRDEKRQRRWSPILAHLPKARAPESGRSSRTASPILMLSLVLKGRLGRLRGLDPSVLILSTHSQKGS